MAMSCVDILGGGDENEVKLIKRLTFVYVEIFGLALAPQSGRLYDTRMRLISQVVPSPSAPSYYLRPPTMKRSRAGCYVWAQPLPY